MRKRPAPESIDHPENFSIDCFATYARTHGLFDISNGLHNPFIRGGLGFTRLAADHESTTEVAAVSSIDDTHVENRRFSRFRHPLAGKAAERSALEVIAEIRERLAQRPGRSRAH